MNNFAFSKSFIVDSRMSKVCLFFLVAYGLTCMFHQWPVWILTICNAWKHIRSNAQVLLCIQPTKSPQLMAPLMLYDLWAPGTATPKRCMDGTSFGKTDLVTETCNACEHTAQHASFGWTCHVHSSVAPLLAVEPPSLGTCGQGNKQTIDNQAKVDEDIRWFGCMLDGMYCACFK